MRKGFWTLMLLVVAVMATAGNGELTLVADGKPCVVIALSSDAVPAEKTAARELQSFVAEMTGATLKIVSDRDVSGPAVYIGQSEVIRDKLEGIDFTELRPDEIILRSVDDGLVLSGARPRGTLYAVYALLEEQFGIRFWSSTETDVPHVQNLIVPKLSIRYAPVFAVREATGFSLGDPIFAVRSRNNGNWQQIPTEYGGHEQLLGWCHTFSQLLPPGEFFLSHPEWYAEVGGKRVPHGQLCLSNPQVAEALTARAAEWLRATPDAKMISISQNDGFGFCECSQCREIAMSEGSASGVLLTCVNRVAERLDREFPGVMVETLAYRDTRKPPRHIRPANNVMIRLCSIEANFAYPLDASGNAQFKQDVETWSAIAGRLMIWNYTANYANYLIPYPNLLPWARDLRFLATNHAKAVFLQGDNGSNGMGDFNLLRSWLTSQLMWNPELEVGALLEEFIRGYYGPAADSILQYWNILFAAMARNPDVRIHCYLDNTESWLPLKELLAARAMMQQALTECDHHAPYYDRVCRAARACDLALLLRPEALDPIQRKSIGMTFEEMQELARRLLASYEADGVRVYGENLPMTALAARLRQLYALEPRVELPAEARVLAAEAAERSRVIPAKNTTLLEEGNLTFREKDPAAVGGETIRLRTPHESWRLIQFPLGGLHLVESSGSVWKLYAHVRALPGSRGADASGAVRLGVWCSLTDRTVEVELQADALPTDEYRYVPVGTVQLHMGDFLFLLPLENHSLEGIFCDHILLIPEE